MIQPDEYWCLLTSGICSFPKTLWSRLEDFTIFCHAGFRANNLVEYCRRFFWEHPWWSRCFHESLQARKDRLISEINWYLNHGCIQNPVKHLRWSVLDWKKGLKSVNYFRRKLHFRWLTRFCTRLCHSLQIWSPHISQLFYRTYASCCFWYLFTVLVRNA